MFGRSLSAVVTGLALTIAPITAASAATGPQHRIVGGHQATEGAYPWMVRLSMTSTDNKTYLCGGTMISPDVVLTAAHCSGNIAKFTANIGKVDWKTAADAGQQRTGTKLKAGPGPKKGDWSVLKLDAPFTPASYPKLAQDTSADTTPMFRAMGWGTTSSGGTTSQNLLEVDLPLVPDAKCGAAAAAEICAGDMDKGGIDTCQGDSGGPLVAKVGETWVQVGITSWGIGCAAKGQAGHYAEVSKYIADIKAAITAIGGTQPA